jgi:hypothetical protein
MKKFPLYAALMWLSLALAPTAQAKQTFTITQGKPEIRHVDIGATGMSVGDLFGFEAPFTTQDGKKVGFMELSQSFQLLQAQTTHLLIA